MIPVAAGVTAEIGIGMTPGRGTLIEMGGVRIGKKRKRVRKNVKENTKMAQAKKMSWILQIFKNFAN